MIKKKLYGSTMRFKRDEVTILTEKLDGSNLVFFKLQDKLHIAERKTIFTMDELHLLEYGGLRDWLKEHGKELEELLVENAAIIGEWLGMGRLKYDFPQRFMQFAKANVYQDLELVNVRYENQLFQHSFKSKVIPDFIGQVPVVGGYETSLTLDELNTIYDDYLDEVGRPVEGFIINTYGNIRKYVRNKRGRLEDHMEYYPTEVQRAQLRLL